VSQPVKLSDSLVLEARLTGEAVKRSIAGQIEFWARLGRAIEPLLQGIQSLALSRAGAATSLADAVASVDSAEGRGRLVAHLQAQPYPHYEAVAGAPGLLQRTEANGKRTIGRFVRREFKLVTKRSGRR